MSAEQIMRHIRAFLQQPPLLLPVLIALAFTSYSLRCVLSTLADRRLLPLGVRIAMGDWAEAPSDVLVGARAALRREPSASCRSDPAPARLVRGGSGLCS